MIISETSLSFLGLGLRPPAISWGILLQDAQNIETLALAPWLLAAAVPVIVVILAFNFSATDCAMQPTPMAEVAPRSRSDWRRSCRSAT